MSLQEYLNQEDPIRKPIVVFEEHEIRRGVHTKITGFTSAWVEGLDHEYALFEDSGVFYTIDGDGNPLNVSVFRTRKNIFVAREKSIDLPHN